MSTRRYAVRVDGSWVKPLGAHGHSICHRKQFLLRTRKYAKILAAEFGGTAVTITTYTVEETRARRAVIEAAKGWRNGMGFDDALNDAVTALMAIERKQGKK